MLTRFIRRPLINKINVNKCFNSTTTNTNLLQEVKEIKVNVDHTNYILSRIYLVSCLTGGLALGEIVGTLLAFLK